MDSVNESRSGDMLENIYASISINSRGVKKKMAAGKKRTFIFFSQDSIATHPIC